MAQGHGSIKVVFGTKGDKVQATHLPNPVTALAVVREALHVLVTQRRLAQGRTLKQAEAWYRNAMHRLGVQGYSLRYGQSPIYRLSMPERTRPANSGPCWISFQSINLNNSPTSLSSIPYMLAIH